MEKSSLITINKKDYPPLLQSINFQINYREDLDLFVGRNDYYNIRASSQTLKQLKENLILIIDSNVDIYFIQARLTIFKIINYFKRIFFRKAFPKPSKKFREDLDRLEKIIDLKQRKDRHWVPFFPFSLSS